MLQLRADAVYAETRRLLTPGAKHVDILPIKDRDDTVGIVIAAWDRVPGKRKRAAVARYLQGFGIAGTQAPIETRSHADRLRAAVKAVSEIGPQVPAEDLKPMLVEICRRALETDLVAIFTIDPYMGGIDCTATASVTASLQSAFLESFGERFAGWGATEAWLQTGLSETGSSAQGASAAFSDANIDIVCACPLASGCGVSGTLAAFYQPGSRVAKSDLDLIQTISSQVSSALSYALAIEQTSQLLDGLAGENRELSQQATRDGLTGLANHRTLQQVLSDLCASHTPQHPRVFSLVMIDVDHFKMYNDMHGHPEGDAALAQVARVLSSGLRQNDLAARYGGEEFALVLRGTSKSDAEAIADRLRRDVADQPCPRGPLTISLGVAEFPTDGANPGEIIDRADKALYHAKVTGRNRVVVWGGAGCGPADSRAERKDSACSTVSVLVVEPDTRSNGSRLKDLLSAENYRIESSSDSAEGTALLRTRAFDIALVSGDAFPKGDWQGLSNMSAIHPDMPIVLVTDALPLDESREVLRRGASDIVLKPYNPAELPVVVERNLERRRLERQRMVQKSTGLMMQAIDALVAAIDARDHYTAGHSQGVTSTALMISDELEISSDDRYALELAARLHDIGKLGLPDSALNKQSSLTDEEWQAMREHPALGSKIVGEIDELSYVSTLIRHHHEKLDGTGYPDGLSGPAIPFLSQVIAVADAYEAMTSERAHRRGLSPAEAIAELRGHAGTHYNAAIITVLEKQLIANGAIVSEGEAADRAA